ncbi:MAG: M2 family metallopeptidase, partial [Proteobacteria bacterium]|nr:M2 family metallopeptidase [Pseudomonadota bacterium]
MKKLPEIFTGVLLVVMISACSQPSSENAAMTETAEQFVERANTELDELSREIGAAEWVRSTYITQDTAIIAAAASEKYAKWHSGMVQLALAYDDQELSPETQRAI